MPAQNTDDGSSARLERIAMTAMAGIAIAFIVGLTICTALRIWPFERSGHPAMVDFVIFWEAGRLALQGTPHFAYVPHVLHLAEVQTVGHDVPASLQWLYPPLFLCVAVVLASLPFALSFALWNGATFVTYAGVMTAITKRPVVGLAAAACPWAVDCLYIGQEGLLTASIIGGTLLLLNRRPALAGLLLGLLSFKPQLGLLFPVALAFGGYWRAVLWASIGTLAWTAGSVAAFGPGTMFDFLHSLTSHTDGFLARDEMGWYNLQSMYAFARGLGAPGIVCWLFQAFASMSCVVAIAALWRSNMPFCLKAAGLAAAIPVATPYVLVYDQTVLAVALGFLIYQRRLDIPECATVAFSILITSWAWSNNSAAALASVAVCAVVSRRILLEKRSRSRGTSLGGEPGLHHAQAYAA
ncbi:MAG TPA: glycosyltransferase family 87 protein [Rhizomicrobium sp.]|nr:glycosyltransferase family 87 protein [Rhizomicrobium sp.]